MSVTLHPAHCVSLLHVLNKPCPLSLGVWTRVPFMPNLEVIDLSQEVITLPYPMYILQVGITLASIRFSPGTAPWDAVVSLDLPQIQGSIDVDAFVKHIRLARTHGLRTLYHNRSILRAGENAKLHPEVCLLDYYLDPATISYITFDAFEKDWLPRFHFPPSETYPSLD